jgi:ABC-type Na+ transport system ATPase subunit NatA
VSPTEGTASVAGHDLRRAAQRVRASVGLATDVLGLDAQQTPDEYLAYLGALYGVTGAVWRKRIDELYAIFGLTDVRARRIATLSLGTRQKLALCRALLHRPPVLLLDEPTNGLDPIAARVVHGLIRDYRAAGRAVALCTHDLIMAQDLADAVLFLANGRVVHHGPVTRQNEALAPRPALERLFFESMAAPLTPAASPVVAWGSPTPPAITPAVAAARLIAAHESRTVSRADRTGWMDALSLVIVPLGLGGATAAAWGPAAGVFFSGTLYVLVAANNVATAFVAQLENGSLGPLLATPTSDGALWGGKVAGALLRPLAGWLLVLTLLVGTSWAARTLARGEPWSWAEVGAWALFGLSQLVVAVVAASWLVGRARSVAQAQSRAVILFLMQLLLGAVAGALAGLAGPAGLLTFAVILLIAGALAAVGGQRRWRRDEVLARR